MGNGAGSQPAGSSPAGIGSPSTAAAQGNPVIFPDARTGFSQTGRSLNPITKDYVFTSDGRSQGFGTTPQRMQLALTTVFNSSAIPGFGQQFTSVREKGPNYQRQLTTFVQNAVSHLVKEKAIVLNEVDVSDVPGKPGAAYMLVQWTDLTTSIAATTRVGIPSGIVEHLNIV
jgi:hypothetical protein